MTEVVEHAPPQPHARPEWARWGTQTQLAVQNFPISGLRIDRHLIRALAAIKAEAALVNERLGVLDAPTARAITTPPTPWLPAATTTNSPSTCSRPVRARRRT